jgi:tetratricopeptide (TPR) repeat protein
MIELNLPDRLIESLKKDPDDLYFQFAAAYYSWKGRNLAPENALIFSPRQVKEIFNRCWKKNIYTSESLLFLAVEELKEHAYTEKACELLEKSYEVRSGNFAVDMAYLELLIHRKQYDAAMPVAQNLVDFSQDPVQKRQILTATARLLFLKKDYQRSLVTCKKILTLFPDDTQALWVSLDCYRALNLPEDYLVFLGSRIRFNNFESYLVYLSKRSIIPWDHHFYDLFQTLPAQEKEPAGWRSAFSGFLKKEMGQAGKAMEHFRKALAEVKKEDPENKAAIEGLNHEIEILDKKLQTP